MVLITGCPLLNEKSPTCSWKRRKQFDPCVQPMGLKQSYQWNCWFAIFYPRLGKTRYFSFLGFLGKTILENLHGNRLIYIVPIRKRLRLFGGNVVEWLVRWTCNSVAPSSSPALTASWICFTVVPSSDPRPRSWIADWICRRPDWIFNPITGLLTLAVLIAQRLAWPRKWLKQIIYASSSSSSSSSLFKFRTADDVYIPSGPG